MFTHPNFCWSPHQSAAKFGRHSVPTSLRTVVSELLWFRSDDLVSCSDVHRRSGVHLWKMGCNHEKYWKNADVTTENGMTKRGCHPDPSLKLWRSNRSDAVSYMILADLSYEWIWEVWACLKLTSTVIPLYFVQDLLLYTTPSRTAASCCVQMYVGY